jgi:hypothetical protein
MHSDHRGDGKRFVVRADELLSAFVELERGIDLLRRPELNSRLHLPKPVQPAEDRSRKVNAFVFSNIAFTAS